MDFLRDLLMNNDGEAGMAGGPTSGTMDSGMGGMGGMGAMDASGGLGPTPGPSTMPMPPQPPSPVETQQQPQQGGMLPPSARQPGPIKRMLMDFSSTLRESLQKEMGVPTDTERAMAAQKMQMAQQAAQRESQFRQAQLTHYQGELELRKRQTAAMEAAAAAKSNQPKDMTVAEREVIADRLNLTGDVRKRFTAQGDLPQDFGKRETPDKNVNEWQTYLDAANGDPNKALAMKQANEMRLRMAGKDTSATDTRRSDLSYRFHTNAIDKMSQPIEATAQRLENIKATLRQNNMQADALVAPELLTVMAGGQGSGLRMNEAEIARIVGGRTQWENLKAAAQRWSLDPSTATSITSEQRKQIRALVGEVDKRVGRQRDMLGQARSDIAGTDDPAAHKQIYSDMRAKYMSGGGAPVGPEAAPANGWGSIFKKSIVH